MSNTHFKDASLIDSNLSNCDLSNAQFHYANLINTNFSNAKLISTQNLHSKLIKTNFSNADLSDSSWVDCFLSANFTKSNLKNAKFYFSNLANSDLIEADLTNAYLNSVNLTNANLTNANLTSANLTDANLTSANLTNANLTNAYLRNLNLTNANLTDANLAETILSPLNNVRRFESIKIDQIIIWEHLSFRSQSEVKIAEELDKRNLLFFPNSAARLTTKKGRENKEPDFLVCYKTTKGFKWGILEVDGPYHTPERRVEEQERERDFERNGVRIYRYDSTKCYTEPNQVVDDFLELLENQN